MKPSANRTSSQIRGTAATVRLAADARRAGVSLGAAELLGVLREERRRRAGAACVPSVRRLAELVGVGERTVQRRLAELAAAGLLWRCYRGGKGARTVYYLVRPRALGPGWTLLDRSAKGDNSVTLTGPHSLSLEKDLETTEGAPSSASDAPAQTSPAGASRPENEPLPPAPAPRAGEHAVSPGTLAFIWAVWLRVYRARTARAYRRDERDGSVAVAIGRRFQGFPDGERALSLHFARYLASGTGADKGSPLWLCPVAAPVLAPVSWSARNLRHAGPPPAPEGPRRARMELALPREHRELARARCGAVLELLGGRGRHG